MTALKCIAGWRQMQTVDGQLYTANTFLGVRTKFSFLNTACQLKLFEVSIEFSNKIKLVQMNYLTSVKSH